MSLVYGFGIVEEIFLRTYMDTKIFLVPFAIYIIYSLFGAVPTVIKSKYKINLTLNWVNIGSIGFDWLGSWIGRYENGINYFIHC